MPPIRDWYKKVTTAQIGCKFVEDAARPSACFASVCVCRGGSNVGAERLEPPYPHASHETPPKPDETPLQLAAVQLSHCMWGLHAWGPRGSDPTAGEVTAADPVPSIRLQLQGWKRRLLR